MTVHDILKIINYLEEYARILADERDEAIGSYKYDDLDAKVTDIHERIKRFSELTVRVR